MDETVDGGIGVGGYVSKYPVNIICCVFGCFGLFLTEGAKYHKNRAVDSTHIIQGVPTIYCAVCIPSTVRDSELADGFVTWTVAP